MKTCNEFNCTRPVFSNHYCLIHQYLRTDEKYLTKKNQPKKVYELKRTKLTYKRENTGEAEIFKQIAQERDPVSYISGLRIKFVASNFAHVLSKAQNKYPLFKLNKRNIALLTEREHELFDAGTEAQREKYKLIMAQAGVIVDWEKLYTLKEELKQEYNGLK